MTESTTADSHTMHIKHTAVADPDIPVGTQALIHEQHTNGRRVYFDDDTGEGYLEFDDLPEDYRELQAIAKDLGLDASQSEADLREELDGRVAVPDGMDEQICDHYDAIAPADGDTDELAAKDDEQDDTDQED